MSSPYLVRVGQPITDSFIYLLQDAVRTPVTGKVQADFTLSLSLNGVGNQSTSEITISEVDAVHNPGEYSVGIASTAFPAATGTYLLTIKDTAATQYRWDQTYIVTNDGTMSGSTGTASFTAAMGNGRVTGSGALPVSGATVIIRAPSGATYATLSSDASGLWGAVYFIANGTYTIIVNAAGYQQATASIVVIGGVATGPGADIALAAGTVASALTANDLWSYARRASRNQTSPQATLEQQQATQEALEMIAKAHRWPWYMTKGQFTIYGAVSVAGTVTKGSANVVVTTGTLPSWAGANFKVFVNGQIIRIASVTDSTRFAFEAPWNETTTTDMALTIFQDELPLPNDFYIFGQFLPGQRWATAPVMIGAEQIYSAQNAVNYALRFPNVCAVIKQSLLIYPYPTMDQLASYTYWRRPATLVTGSDPVDWDPAHTDLLHRAIDYQVAIRFGGFAGGSVEDARNGWVKALAEATSNDRESSSEGGLLSPLMPAVPIWARRGTGSP